MEPKPVEQELLKQEREGARAPRLKPKRAPDFPFDFNWWVGDPYVRALDPVERASLMDVMCFSLKTPRPGVMTEENVRSWANYTVEGWAAARGHFLPLFRVRPDGTWTMPELRTVFLAQLRRLRRARAASKTALQNRWRTKGLARRAPGKKMRPQCDSYTNRNASLLSSQGESTPVPEVELSRGDPGFEGLSRSAPDEVGPLIRTVTAGLVRGRSGA